MSRHIRSLPATAPVPTLDASTSRQSPLRSGLAVAWIILFCGWFYSFGLPNNRPVERWMVWTVLPFDLLDLIDPPVEANRPAWSWFDILQRAPFLGIALVVWISAVCFGRLELRALGLDSRFCRSERFFFAGCLGLATVSLMMLGLGLVGWMGRWPLLVLLLAGSLVEFWLTWRDRRLVWSCSVDFPVESPNSGDTTSQWLPWIVLGVGTLFVCGMLLGAMSPQTDFDVIEYHLGGPKEWFLQGRIARLPHNVYTSFPFLTEMLTLSGMVLYGDWQWGALAGQAVIAGFAPLTAVGLVGTGRRWFLARAGWLAALIWLTTPWVYRISIIAYAEGGLACYLFAAFAIGLQIIWRDADVFRSAADEVGWPGLERPREAPESKRRGFPAVQPRPPESGFEIRSRVGIGLYALCGAFAGSAMACKYTGLISVIVPVTALLIWPLVTRSLRKRTVEGPDEGSVESTRARPTIMAGLAFAAAVGMTIGPWLLKNAVETGNPVFPLAYKIFGGEGRDAAMNAQWSRGHSSHYASLSQFLWDVPVKVTDVVANNDWHSALMFALAPIALLASWRRRVWLVWAIIGWQFLSWFLFTHHIDRFYVPMFPLVALLAGCGASFLLSLAVGRWIAIPLMAASILFNVWIMQHFGGYNAGRTDLKTAAELVVSPSQRWLDDELAAGRLPRDFKVLCVGEAALFHAQFPYVYNTVFDRSLFEQWFAERTESGEFRLRPIDQIRETLHQHGITHVLVNWAEILRYREQGSYGYTDFANPDSFAALQSAGLLDRPLPLPEVASLAPVSDAKRKQVAEWAPTLLISLPEDHSAIRAVQIFPVKQ